MNINWHDKEPTFEEVCPKAEFSELIRLVLMLTDAVRRLWARVKSGPNRPPPIEHFGRQARRHFDIGGETMAFRSRLR